MSRNKRLLSFLVVLSTALIPCGASAQNGTWYLALDAEPFGLPPGSNLAGTATLHHDRTLLIEDGGDFGGLPFATRNTAQFGSWRRTEGGIQAVTLFLEGDTISGEVRSWTKVHFSLEYRGNRTTLVGTVNVFQLACDEPAPFPVFGCPDPIANAAKFTAVPPFDVPVRLKRLPARFVSPE